MLLLTIVLALGLADAISANCELLFGPTWQACGCDYPTKDVYVLRCQQRGLLALPLTTANPPRDASLTGVVVTANFSGNSISSIEGDYFRHNAWFITSLDFSKNAIADLGSASFTGLETKLKALYISNNKLNRLAPGVFDGLRLKELDLSFNTLSDPCSLRIQQVDYLHLGGNGIKSLTHDCFRGSQSENEIKILDLSDNLVVDIAPTAFDGVRDLQELVLSGNRLANVGNERLRSLERQSRLATLRLRNNGMASIDAICAYALPQVTLLDLGGNELQQITPYCFKRYYGDTTPLSLLLDSGRISIVDENAFSGLEKRLESLSLAKNAITVVVVTAFEKLGRLKSLNLSYNKLTSLNFLCGWETDSLVQLSLSNNNVHALPWTKCFRNLKGLDSLDLSGNRLLFVGNDAFAGLSNLMSLNLNDNFLSSLSERAFSGLQTLQRLKVSGNTLVYLRRCTFEILTKLIEFHYDANLMHCDCSLYWLKPFTRLVSSRGMLDPKVTVPVRHATCSTPASMRERSLIDVVSSCEETSESCLGLSVLDITLHGADLEPGLNVSWQIGSDLSSTTSLSSFNVTLTDTADGAVSVLGQWPAGFDVGRQLSLAAPVRKDATYKVCVGATLPSAAYQTDCSVYPVELQKPTGAPASEEVVVENLHSGIVAAIVLAVILMLCITTALLVMYFMYKKWHSYQPRKEDDLAEREKTSSSSRKSPTSSEPSGEDSSALPECTPMHALLYDV